MMNSASDASVTKRPVRLTAPCNARGQRSPITAAGRAPPPAAGTAASASSRAIAEVGTSGGHRRRRGGKDIPPRPRRPIASIIRPRGPPINSAVRRAARFSLPGDRRPATPRATTGAARYRRHLSGSLPGGASTAAHTDGTATHSHYWKRTHPRQTFALPAWIACFFATNAPWFPRPASPARPGPRMSAAQAECPLQSTRSETRRRRPFRHAGTRYRSRSAVTAPKGVRLMGRNPGKSVRAFIGVRVPCSRAVRRLLRQIAALDGAVKPVEPENLHLTLRFLGDTPLTEIPAIADAARRAAATQSLFTDELHGIGVFPRADRPRVVWLGLDNPLAWSALFTALDGQLAAIGFPSEKRPFTPHLTIARIKGRPPAELDDILARNRDAAFGEFEITQLEVLQSELTPRGPIYTTLAEAPLSKA
ncbi:MAG: RNA 2',3'-cyclic phosphodiesterase [Planctomycetota bacterium]|nr:MAG: RNA 2',3'-cyclic phosphodiesterase [Planctomycetota bacterium]